MRPRLKYRLLAMWEIFTSRGFYLVHKDKSGKMWYRMSCMDVEDTYNIQDNVRELRDLTLDDAAQRDAVALAENIINATNNNNI
jgi:hypothetical protein